MRNIVSCGKQEDANYFFSSRHVFVRIILITINIICLINCSIILPTIKTHVLLSNSELLRNVWLEPRIL